MLITPRLTLLAFAALLASASANAAASSSAGADIEAEPLRMTDQLATRPSDRQQVVGSDTLLSPALQLQIADQMSGRQRATMVVTQALSLIGSRYQLGGDGLSTFDCSALVGSAYRAIGLLLPRTSRELMLLGTRIERHALQPGDLLFFRWRRQQLHVAVYAGDGEIVHASPGEHQVTRSALTALWKQRLVVARRLI